MIDNAQRADANYARNIANARALMRVWADEDAERAARVDVIDLRDAKEASQQSDTYTKEQAQ